MFCTRRRADQPGAAAVRGFGAQCDGAAVAVIAADAQHAAEMALVRAPGARLQPQVQRVRTRETRGGFEIVKDMIRKAERIDHHLAGRLAAAAGVQPGLAGDEAQGDGGAHRQTMMMAGVGIHARRHVERQHRR